jgi:tRNA U34 5-methylaminomethyl-2-thiouridine-forming methyltransferase MnmC
MWGVVLTSDGSRTLQRVGGKVAYHSTSGAATESRHVFLNNSGIFDRSAAAAPARVLEIGFGTGLNFLLTADRAIASGQSLAYTAVDHALLSPGLFDEMGFRGLVSESSLVDQLAGFLSRPSRYVRQHEIDSGDINCQGARSFCINFDATAPINPVLELWIADFMETTLPAGPFDTIYFDPFSPEIDGRPWDSGFLVTMRDTLKCGGTLVSYCVKSVVQKSLRESGFRVQTVPGPAGGKRQVLIATRIDQA